jgi:uncharacterized protein (TIGR03083 family)
MEIWPTVHTERNALAGDLRGLSDEDWAKPSLCDDWTVRDVLAHMTSAPRCATTGRCATCSPT